MTDEFERQLAQGIRRLGEEAVTGTSDTPIDRQGQSGLTRRSRTKPWAAVAVAAAAVIGAVAVPVGVSAMRATPASEGPLSQGAAASSSSPTSAVAEVTAASACPADAPIQEAPETLQGVDAVYQCIDMVEQEQISVQRVTAGLPELVAAYRQPDRAYQKGQRCTFNQPSSLALWFHASGQIYQVAAARDGCGFPTTDSAAAFDNLTMEEVVKQEQEPVTAAVVLLKASAPSDATRNARVSGPLNLQGDCVSVGSSVAIWPYGTTVVSESPLRIRVPGAGVFTEGDEVVGAGGLFDAATDDVSVRIPDSCGTTLGTTINPHLN